MRRFLYLSHPQVVMDPGIPVPDWGLSESGVRRVSDWVASEIFGDVARIICSAERKAVETSELIAGAVGMSFEVRPRSHENDRSSTGFLDATAFEVARRAFFTEPDVSYRGWERARDAQARIVAEASDLVGSDDPGDVLMVGHGAVGTLLYCHHSGRNIDLDCDQVAGGGCVWALDRERSRVLHGWRPAEDLGREAGPLAH